MERALYVALNSGVDEREQGAPADTSDECAKQKLIDAREISEITDSPSLRARAKFNYWLSQQKPLRIRELSRFLVDNDAALPYKRHPSNCIGAWGARCEHMFHTWMFIASTWSVIQLRREIGMRGGVRADIVPFLLFRDLFTWVPTSTWRAFHVGQRRFTRIVTRLQQCLHEHAQHPESEQHVWNSRFPCIVNEREERRRRCGTLDFDALVEVPNFREFCLANKERRGLARQILRVMRGKLHDRRVSLASRILDDAACLNADIAELVAEFVHGTTNRRSRIGREQQKQ